MTRIRIFTGVANSDWPRTIDALAVGGWGTTFLVLPSRREAIDRADRLILEHQLQGAWGDCILSFEDLARAILRDQGIFPFVVDEIDRRLLIESGIQQLRNTGRLDALGSAADSPGFANHALRIINKLKQAAIDPDMFRAAINRRNRPSWLDAIVASVYDAYQGALRDSRAYDRVGLYWQSDLALRSGSSPLFTRARTVIFDGFDDFTPSEFRVLVSLRQQVDEIVFGVPCDAESASSRDLFAVPLATLRKLAEAFPESEIQHFHGAPTGTRVEHVATNLFWRDKPDTPTGLVENLTLLPCHDLAHELETIGRRVKRLIVDDGIRPERIAVVYRKLEPVHAHARSIFTEYQVPLVANATPPLSEFSFPAFLHKLLESLRDWERESVLDVIGSSWFVRLGPAPESHVGAFGLLARYAGVLEGKSEWLDGVSKLEDWLAHGDGERRGALLHRQPEARSAAQSLLARLQELERIERFLASATTLREFCNRMEQLIVRCKPDIQNDESAVQDEAEKGAVGVLLKMLRRMAAWDTHLPGGASVDTGEFATLFRRACEDAPVSLPQPRDGVRLLDADAARHHSADYLFLAGMNEGVFPMPPTGNAIYTDEDIEDLTQAGAEIESRSRQIEREMLLLHQVLANTSVAATVSWQLVSGDGRALAASPFVDDIRELSGQGALELPRSTSFVPKHDNVASQRDLRLAAAASAEIDRLFPDDLHDVIAGANVEEQRNNKAPFDHYDGVLSDPELIHALAAQYGPEHAFSVAQLESYAECPFQFYLNRVLRIDEVETPVAEFDPRTRGRILHASLEQFHRQHCGKAPGELDPVTAIASMHAIVDDVFDRYARREITAPRGVIAVERARMHAQLGRYVTLLCESEDEWRPTYFEVGFGRTPGADADPLSRGETFRLVTPIGDVQLSGRIDRIDAMNEVVRIVDYKTSIGSPARAIESGVALQLSVYAVALQEFLKPGSDCTEARLLRPGTTDSAEALQRKRNRWPDRELAMRAGIAKWVGGIRAGHFPPEPFEQQCRICANSRVCRYQERRAENKGGFRDAADA